MVAIGSCGYAGSGGAGRLRGSSTPNPTATVVATATTVASTHNVEPTGEPVETVVIATNAPEPLAPTSTLYAAGEPTPTVLAGAQCSYANFATLKFQSFEEMRAELHACNAGFAWPAGYEIDVEKLAFMGDTVGGWEVGSGRTIIAYNNACAWMTSWVDLRQMGDLDGADKTLTYMANTLPYWENPGPPNPANANPVFQGPIDKAVLGDPSLVMFWVNGEECATYRAIRVNP